jgi:hypothetical protein
VERLWLISRAPNEALEFCDQLWILLFRRWTLVDQPNVENVQEQQCVVGLVIQLATTLKKHRSCSIEWVVVLQLELLIHRYSVSHHSQRQGATKVWSIYFSVLSNWGQEMRLQVTFDWESPTKLAQKLHHGRKLIHVNDHDEQQLASKPDLISVLLSPGLYRRWTRTELVMADQVRFRSGKMEELYILMLSTIIVSTASLV